MNSSKIIRGHVIQGKRPNWVPLLDLASDHIDDFMWMFEVGLEGGQRLDAYKHYWTRNYLFLSGDGRAYVYLADSKYEEVDPHWLLDLVLS